MTHIHERIFIEGPYVQAAGVFERRLGLGRTNTEGSCQLTLIAPLPEGRQIARQVAARTKRLPGAANFTSRYAVAWAPGRTARGIPTPGFEGTLTLGAGEAYDECELQLEGRYDAPGGATGKIFDDVIGRRIAHATLVSLLDGVGRELHEAHERVEAEKKRAG